MPVSFLDLVPKRPTSTVTIEAEDGERVPFEELPKALDAMEQRQTTGRVIVEL